jgi:SAM-dependent methyltransferase
VTALPEELRPRRRPAWRYFDTVAERYPPQVDEDGRLTMDEGDWRAVQFFVDEMRGRQRVLDVGSGSGHPSLLVAETVAEVVGVDRAPGMVALARRRAAKLGRRNVWFLVADAGRLPFCEGTFDGAELLGALESMDEALLALREVFRALATGGLVVCLDEDWGDRRAKDPAGLLCRRFRLDGGKLYYQFVQRGPEREVDWRYELDPTSDFVRVRVDLAALEREGRIPTSMQPEELDPDAVIDAWYDDSEKFTEGSLVRLFEDAGFANVRSRVERVWESEILLTAQKP